ncbi:MAG: VCBS repeat-containing protein [Rhodocyclaceae bacterium]|nr:VCBS repeat-containing protein [Rhodocyclaceae bacterium]
MRITSSQLELQAQHHQRSRQSVRESLTAWVGDRPGRAVGEGDRASRPQRSATPDRPAQPPRAHRAAEESARDCRAGERTISAIGSSLLKALAEMLTGREIEVFDASELETDAESAPTPGDPAPGATAAPSRAGFGVIYERIERIERSETLDFSARGQVTTADGRSIGFQVELSMASQFVRESRTSIRMGDAAVEDPLVINFDGLGARLLGERMAFDINADGQADSIARLAAGSGYLVFDRNRNGTIDDGSELFGPSSGDGFAELRALDDDGNGWIDEADAAFGRLGVWTPGGPIQGLAAAQVGAIATQATATPFTATDAEGDTLGQLRASSVYLSEAGQAGLVQQLDLAV